MIQHADSQQTREGKASDTHTRTRANVKDRKEHQGSRLHRKRKKTGGSSVLSSLPDSFQPPSFLQIFCDSEHCGQLKKTRNKDGGREKEQGVRELWAVEDDSCLILVRTHKTTTRPMTLSCSWCSCSSTNGLWQRADRQSNSTEILSVSEENEGLLPVPDCPDTEREKGTSQEPTRSEKKETREEDEHGHVVP